MLSHLNQVGLLQILECHQICAPISTGQGAPTLLWYACIIVYLPCHNECILLLDCSGIGPMIHNLTHQDLSFAIDINLCIHVFSYVGSQQCNLLTIEELRLIHPGVQNWVLVSHTNQDAIVCLILLVTFAILGSRLSPCGNANSI